MTGYNSGMHKRNRKMKKYSLEERTSMKNANIRERQRIKEGLDKKPNPFRGVVRFIDFLKKKKGDKNAQETTGAKKGRHQTQKR